IVSCGSSGNSSSWIWLRSVLRIAAYARTWSTGALGSSYGSTDRSMPSMPSRNAMNASSSASVGLVGWAMETPRCRGRAPTAGASAIPVTSRRAARVGAGTVGPHPPQLGARRRGARRRRCSRRGQALPASRARAPGRGTRNLLPAPGPNWRSPVSEPARADASPADAAGPRRPSLAARVAPWAITIACFAFLWTRIDGAARRQGSAALPFLMSAFARVDWWTWLALMIPYAAFFFLVDSLVVWRVVNWFNARVPLRDILPVRASTYILSILNEQVGKGVMAYYLNRRDGVPGWQVGSSMLFIMFCEF